MTTIRITIEKELVTDVVSDPQARLDIDRMIYSKIDAFDINTPGTLIALRTEIVEHSTFGPVAFDEHVLLAVPR